MNLRKLFWRKDLIAQLRIEPTEDERATLLLSERELRRGDILRNAPVSMSPWTNVARGTWGYDVLSLVHEGLLEAIYAPGVLTDESCHRYALTARGREVLAKLEKGG